MLVFGSCYHCPPSHFVTQRLDAVYCLLLRFFSSKFNDVDDDDDVHRLVAEAEQPQGDGNSRSDGGRQLGSCQQQSGSRRLCRWRDANHHSQNLLHLSYCRCTRRLLSTWILLLITSLSLSSFHNFLVVFCLTAVRDSIKFYGGELCP